MLDAASSPDFEAVNNSHDATGSFPAYLYTLMIYQHQVIGLGNELRQSVPLSGLHSQCSRLSHGSAFVVFTFLVPP